MAKTPVLRIAWPPRERGLLTTRAGVRNATLPPAPALRGLAERLTQLANSQARILFRKSVKATETLNVLAATNTWRFQFVTGPTTTRVRMVATTAPHVPSVWGVRSPRFRWTVTEVGGSSSTKDYIHNTVCAPTTTVTPDLHIGLASQDWAVSPSTVYRAQLEVTDYMRVLSVTCYEGVERTRLSTGFIDARKFSDGDPIYTAHLASLVDQTTALWKKGGTHHIAWCAAAATWVDSVGTTHSNIIDASTAWDTTSPGFVTHPNYHASIDRLTTAPAREGIPVTLYAYLKTSVASTATCYFIDAAGTIGSVSSTSTTGEWVTTNVYWSADTAIASLKVDIEIASIDSFGVASVLAAGLYENEV